MVRYRINRCLKEKSDFRFKVVKEKKKKHKEKKEKKNVKAIMKYKQGIIRLKDIT